MVSVRAGVLVGMHVLGASTKVIPAIPGQRPSSSNSLAQSGASGQVRPHHRKSSAQRANRSIGFVRSTPERPTRWAFGACVGPCTWPVGPGYLNGWPFGPKRIEHGPMGRRFAIPGQRPIRSNSLAQSEAPGQVRAYRHDIFGPTGQPFAMRCPINTRIAEPLGRNALDATFCGLIHFTDISLGIIGPNIPTRF